MRGSDPRSPSPLRVALVLPAYNEEGNLTPLITALADVAQRAAFPLRVVVVNDGSSDGTAGELAALEARVPELSVTHHPRNRGMAAALKTGIGVALDLGVDAMVFMDSDLSHDPDALPVFVDALARGADVVLGSRFVPGGGMVGVPLWRRSISRAGNIFGGLVLRMPFGDLTTGYRAIRRQVFERITLGEDGFTIQLESVVKAYAAGFRVVEVPIVLGTRRHGASHMSYNPQLFRDYWRLLQTCRQWLRQRHP